MDDRTFSERHGFSPEPPEITVRQDAPYDLRGLVVDFAYQSGLTPHDVRSIVCDVVMTRPNEENWSAFPNVDTEVRGLLDGCAWYEVYDIIEALYSTLHERQGDPFRHGIQADADSRFVHRLNTFFLRSGIGWQITEGRVEVRGPESFEAIVRPVPDALETSGMPTAAREIREALHDLARRPLPDTTGAMQHAMASVECMAREAAGDPRATLGQILDRHPDLVPRPLDDGVRKMWGYASEMARHIREGREPTYEEAELAVVVSAGVIAYLQKKLTAMRG